LLRGEYSYRLPRSCGRVLDNRVPSNKGSTGRPWHIWTPTLCDHTKKRDRRKPKKPPTQSRCRSSKRRETRRDWPGSLRPTTRSAARPARLDRPFSGAHPHFRRNPEHTPSGERVTCLLNSGVTRPEISRKRENTFASFGDHSRKPRVGLHPRSPLFSGVSRPGNSTPRSSRLTLVVG
jgi:hypothetical protein